LTCEEFWAGKNSNPSLISLREGFKASASSMSLNLLSAPMGQLSNEPSKTKVVVEPLQEACQNLDAYLSDSLSALQIENKELRRTIADQKEIILNLQQEIVNLKSPLIS
jgi:flagellar motility protein MotE (MotC chaperone)